MQFKLLVATLLVSSVAAEYANYMDCLVKKECKSDEPCVEECFQTKKVNPDQATNFYKCARETCTKEDVHPSDIHDWTEFYECLPGCYNEWVGKPNDTQVDLNAKSSDKKEVKSGSGSKGGSKGGSKENSSEGGGMRNSDTKEDSKNRGGGGGGGGGGSNDDATNNTISSKPHTPAPSVFAAFILAVLAL
jgi:hypothetical protein